MQVIGEPQEGGSQKRLCFGLGGTCAFGPFSLNPFQSFTLQWLFNACKAIPSLQVSKVPGSNWDVSSVFRPKALVAITKLPRK